MACKNCGPKKGAKSARVAQVPARSGPRATSPVPSAGNKSSFGSSTRIPRNPCAAAPCPSPLSSDVEDTDPYCPTWAESLTAAVRGRVILMVESCLYYLRSKCTGWLFFDAETQEVTVQDPPFVSRIPAERDWGFLAKVIPGSREICSDDSDNCATEATQELAAQMVNAVDCGELLLGNRPLSGDVPDDENTDAAMQINVGIAALPDIEDVENACSKNPFILGCVDGVRMDGDTPIPCKTWVKVHSIFLPKSKWGPIDPDETDDAKAVALIPTGDDEDQCYRLGMVDAKPVFIDTTDRDPAACDMLRFKDGVWKPYKGPWRPLTSATVVAGWANSDPSGTIKTAVLPDFPDDNCGDVWAQFRCTINVSGASLPVSMNITNFDFGAQLGEIGYGNDVQQVQGVCKVKASSKFKMTKTTAGSPTMIANIAIIGYWV